MRCYLRGSGAVLPQVGNDPGAQECLWCTAGCFPRKVDLQDNVLFSEKGRSLGASVVDDNGRDSVQLNYQHKWQWPWPDWWTQSSLEEFYEHLTTPARQALGGNSNLERSTMIGWGKKKNTYTHCLSRSMWAWHSTVQTVVNFHTNKTPSFSVELFHKWGRDLKNAEFRPF